MRKMEIFPFLKCALQKLANLENIRILLGSIDN